MRPPASFRSVEQGRASRTRALVLCHAEALDPWRAMVRALRARAIVDVFEHPKLMRVAMTQAAYDIALLHVDPQRYDVGALATQIQEAGDARVALLSADPSVHQALAARGAEGALGPDHPLPSQWFQPSRLPKTSAGQNQNIRQAFAQRYRTGDIILESAHMRALFERAHRAAQSEATILIQGESGTGKEKLARFVHDQSPRARGPFVAINCSALSEGTLESELFGHAQGAFTGARRDHKGVFEQAQGGTVLLDEIGDVSGAFQAKLLRVLQERHVRPVGATGERPVDVRVLAATHRDLEACVREGSFRQDLYFRLRVIPLLLPPLRERRQDILPLARHFLRKAAARAGRAPRPWALDVADALQAHPWPGNVRELQSAMEYASAMASGEVLTCADLPEMRPRQPGASGSLASTLEQATRAALGAALDAHAGRRQDAADALGIDRTTLYRLMKKHGMLDA